MRSAVVPILRHEEAVAMGKHKVKPNYRRRLLRLPDLDHFLRELDALTAPVQFDKRGCGNAAWCDY